LPATGLVCPLNANQMLAAALRLKTAQ